LEPFFTFTLIVQLPELKLEVRAPVLLQAYPVKPLGTAVVDTPFSCVFGIKEKYTPPAGHTPIVTPVFVIKEGEALDVYIVLMFDVPEASSKRIYVEEAEKAFNGKTSNKSKKSQYFFIQSLLVILVFIPTKTSLI
jgi:hypothetical protein